MRKILLLAVLLASGFCARAGGIFIECESFFDKGGWVLDQQFIDEMGSSYLLAHGMGKQVADASTTVNIPADGLYTVWARTYNWTSPWSEKPGPGKFQIKIGKKILKPVLGSTGKCWEWQNA
ncbi:MAG: pyridine nucleotide-disulfide oxidoreductase, partial [Bacteroidales bacterium]|nr:pyridine nucleotide-disulfide oxidoreductase [Bacteroidales bacterium]